MIICPAISEEEMEAIHRLNYAAFVEEIPQHAPNPERKLIDKRHHLNQYIIAKHQGQVVGMVCYNFTRPFSLDEKLPDLNSYLPPAHKVAEIRLLAIKREYRKPYVAYRLLQQVCKDLIAQQVELGVISATTRQLKLYTAMGFVPFGPTVGKANAIFQPMYITPQHLRHDLYH